AVTVSPLFTVGGLPEGLDLGNVVVFHPGTSDTVYLPAGTFFMDDSAGQNPYGSFTVSSQLTISDTTGGLAASGNTIDFDPCNLNNVMITPNPGVGWTVGEVVGSLSAADTVRLGEGSYTIFFSRASGGASPATFSVGPNGLSATQLPQDAPLVTLQLVPCAEPPSPVVTTTADVVDPHDFQTSLREAINYANADPGQDTITFAIPTTDPGYQSSTGAFIIKPTSALPTLTDPVVLDGYSQPGASPNTLTIG